MFCALLTTNRQDLVDAILLLHAVHHVGCQVCLADGLARRKGAVAKHDVRLAALHELHLQGSRSSRLTLRLGLVVHPLHLRLEFAENMFVTWPARDLKKAVGRTML